MRLSPRRSITRPGAGSVAVPAVHTLVGWFAVMCPTPLLRAQWLALCNAYTEQIADSLGRRLGATTDPLVADLAAGALRGMVANVLDHVSELSSGQLAHILDKSFVCFVNGFGNRA